MLQIKEDERGRAEIQSIMEILFLLGGKSCHSPSLIEKCTFAGEENDASRASNR